MILMVRNIVLTGLVSLLTIVFAYSQDIKNLTFSVQGATVEIYYDLIADASELFRIEVFSSNNNFTTPLVRVRGDMGKKIAPGTCKKITWDAKAELGSYQGDLDIEIRGFIMPPLIQFKNITTDTKFKRGKTGTIQWKSNTNESNINLELHRLGSKISDIGSVRNNGSYFWSVPKDYKPGKNFKIIAFSPQGKTSSVDFKISRKIPVVLKVLPFVIIGGVVGVLASGGGGESPGGGTTDERIEDPVKPGG